MEPRGFASVADRCGCARKGPPLELDDECLARRAERCRCRSSEPARIAFGGTVLDCAVVNLSHGGAEVCLRSPADVPGLVVLRLPGGESRPMRCVWHNGLHLGLLATGADPPAS